MWRPSGSLHWVFWGMGFNQAQCRHLVKTFDRLRLCNMSSDDWNTRLREWLDKEVMKSTSTVREQLHKCLGIPIEQHSGSERSSLFDEDFQTGIELDPPGRPRG